MMQSLHAKTAIIVGAGGAIGGAIATLFARAGANLCLADQNSQALENVGDLCRKLGAAVELMSVDAVSEESVNAMAARCLH